MKTCICVLTNHKKTKSYVSDLDIKIDSGGNTDVEILFSKNKKDAIDLGEATLPILEDLRSQLRKDNVVILEQEEAE
ncbi:hypothetical protein [Enterococcus italicus]|uniref:hypothetical protein n=1 Tax=Enterococcus italicus TaxID=246144 RepID=UPI003F45471E